MTEPHYYPSHSPHSPSSPLAGSLAHARNGHHTVPGAANAAGPSSGETHGPTAGHPLHTDHFPSGRAVKVARPPWSVAHQSRNRLLHLRVPGHPEPEYIHAPSVIASLAHQPHWHDREPTTAPPVSPVEEPKHLRRSLVAMRQHRPDRRIPIYVALGTLVVMTLTVVGLALWRPTVDIYVVNGLDVPVTVHVDGKRFGLVLPHKHFIKEIQAGDYHITTSLPDGRPLDDEHVSIPGDHDFVGFNVGAAAPLIHTEHDLSTGFDVPTTTLLRGKFVTVKRAEFVFRGGLPNQIFVIGGAKKLMRYTVDVFADPPDWRGLVNWLGLEDREEAARVMETVALTNPTDGKTARRAVEQLARSFGCQRARQFMARLQPFWISDDFDAFVKEREHFMELLMIGGAANEDSGGDPEASPFDEIVLPDPDDPDALRDWERPPGERDNPEEEEDNDDEEGEDNDRRDGDGEGE